MAAFIFNSAKEVVTETEDRTVLHYIRGSELIVRNTDAVRTYYHYDSDEMGSIIHVTDEEENLLNRYEYDAWGNLTLEEEQVSNRFKYTGEQFDAITQQYYLRARFYNPVHARFIQEDTYRGDGLNLYTYCANNPVGYVDPSRHEKNLLLDKEQVQQRVDEYVEAKRAGLDTGIVPSAIVAQGNAVIKALEAVDRQMGHRKNDTQEDTVNSAPNREDTPKADIPRAEARESTGDLERLEMNLQFFAKENDSTTALAVYNPEFAVRQLVVGGETSESLLRSVIPKDIQNTFISTETIKEGYKYNFNINGKKVEIKWHSKDLNAEKKYPNSNSGQGWTAQIKVGNKLMTQSGQFVKKPQNYTHIPLKGSD